MSYEKPLIVIMSPYLFQSKRRRGNQFELKDEANGCTGLPQETQSYTYEHESGLRRQIMPYARNIPKPSLILKA
jgi:hypothetical protein